MMQSFIKALIVFIVSLTISLTNFATFACASPIKTLIIYNNDLAEIPSISFNEIQSMEEVALKVALKVTPKVAKKLVKKYGVELVKIIPVAGTALTVIQISVDLYEEIQRELANEKV